MLHAATSSASTATRACPPGAMSASPAHDWRTYSRPPRKVHTTTKSGIICTTRSSTPLTKSSSSRATPAGESVSRLPSWLMPSSKIRFNYNQPKNCENYYRLPVPWNFVACIVWMLFSLLANVLRYVRYMLSAVRLLSVCCLSVCDVGAPYSGGWTFRQFFFTIR